jgi:excisionase family DNA binding protein
MNEKIILSSIALDELAQSIYSLMQQGALPVEVIPNEIIDRGELCKRLGISEPTAIRWEQKKKIPCFRIGSSVRYNWQKVLQSLEK